MKRDIYILHAHGLLGVTKVVFDDNTPGDIILTVSGSEVHQAEQMFIEETNIDPLDITTIEAHRQYKTVSIPWNSSSVNCGAMTSTSQKH